MNKWLLVICLGLAACKPGSDRATKEVEENDSPEGEELHYSDYGIYFFDYPVKADLVYSLQLHLPERKAYIYQHESGPVIQEFDLSSDLNLEEGLYLEQPKALFSVADVNFDGYADLALLRMTGVVNTWSDYYLFDPAAQHWRFNEKLSEYPNIIRDEKNQLLTFHNHGGYGGAWYESGIMEWVAGEPIIIRKEEQTSGEEEDPRSFIRTIWIQVNGKFKIASKVRISETETGEQQCLLEGNWEEFDRTPFLIFADSEEQVTRRDGRVNGCR